jgi:hypothetical protein
MEDKFEPLDNQEVLCFDWETVGRALNINSNTFSQCNFKIGQFPKIVVQKVSIPEETRKKLFGEGIDCEALRFGAKDWQKGKARIKITVEFCPDEPEVEESPGSNEPEISQPESPLDDIRRMINQEIQQGNS